jgi:uridine monophosphate synthetase
MPSLTSKASEQMTYGERSLLCKHPLAKRLFEIMEKKCTNLALSADVTSAQNLLDLAHSLGPEICVLKTHIDIIDDFHPELPAALRAMAEKHQFLLFEDRKFADIGNTVLHQYEGGVYRISDWAHITNAHPLPGPGIIQGLKKIGLPKGNALLLLAQLSSSGSLIDQNYTKAVMEMALANLDFVIGFICQEKLTDDPALIHMTPGVQLSSTSDDLGQQYNTPAHAIGARMADIAIVGRGIYQHVDPKSAAGEYRHAAWEAYQQRLA